MLIRTVFIVASAFGVAVTLSVVAEAGQRSDVPAGASRPAAAALSPRQVNDVVGKRCVVCHRGTRPAGGLSMEQFDAAAPDPHLAALMLVKITKDGALFAAGEPIPDEFTQSSVTAALARASEHVAADGWTRRS